jgi:hypothetical protein
VPVKSLWSAPNPRYFGHRRGATWLNVVNDQGIGGLVVPGTVRARCTSSTRSSTATAAPDPEVVITDTASYSDIVFGLFAICGYQFSPRIADITDSRTRRIDTTASYGPLDELPRRKIRLTVDQPPAPITQHRTTVVVPVGGEESVELAARGQVSDQLAHPPPIAGARPIGEYLALEPALVPVENLIGLHTRILSEPADGRLAPQASALCAVHGSVAVVPRFSGRGVPLRRLCGSDRSSG